MIDINFEKFADLCPGCDSNARPTAQEIVGGLRPTSPVAGQG